MGQVILTIAVIGVIMLIMAVGAIFKGRCLRGSCGGVAVYGSDGEMLNCVSCPARKDEKAEEDA